MNNLTHGSLFSGVGKNYLYCCEVCGKTFKSYNPHPKFCSLSCKVKSQCSNIDFNDAKFLYEQGKTQEEIAKKFGTTQKVIYNLFKRNAYKCRKSIKRNQYGFNNANWVGNNAIYATLHKRVEVAKGKPKICEVCGESSESKRYEWANITGDYNDIENGYVRMCVSCHRKFDKSEKGIRNYVKRKK